MEVFLEVTVQHKKYHAGFMDKNAAATGGYILLSGGRGI